MACSGDERVLRDLPIEAMLPVIWVPADGHEAGCGSDEENWPGKRKSNPILVQWNFMRYMDLGAR
jgi:hypothetical protein